MCSKESFRPPESKLVCSWNQASLGVCVHEVTSKIYISPGDCFYQIKRLFITVFAQHSVHRSDNQKTKTPLVTAVANTDARKSTSQSRVVKERLSSCFTNRLQLHYPIRRDVGRLADPARYMNLQCEPQQLTDQTLISLIAEGGMSHHSSKGRQTGGED